MRLLACIVACGAISFGACAANTVTTLMGKSGPITLSLSSPSPACGFTSADFFDPNRFAPHFPSPLTVSGPEQMIAFRVDGCGAGQPVRFTMEFPYVLVSDAQWWAFGFGVSASEPGGWHPLPATVSGKTISFTVTDGSAIDSDGTKDGAISLFGMLVVLPKNYQDLWWGGVAQNGWGMSLVQHGDMLFATLFVYDAAGNPVWYVMPGGSWTAARFLFTGSLYLPKGAPFYAYDASKFDIGAPVGTLSIRFVDLDNAILDYTINGVHGSTNITRLLFGPRALPIVPYGDLWWAGSYQNGWGLALMQQNATLFGLWLTYDASGKATWYVMPAGAWQMANRWHGPVFKATGSPWGAGTYDPTKLKLDAVGTFDMEFTGETVGTFSYSVEGHSATILVWRMPF